LRKIIDTTGPSLAEVTERSDYLRAFAMAELGSYHYGRFTRIQLTAPLQEQLGYKRDAMQQSIRLYQAVLELGIDEFVTQAHFRIGDMYLRLGAALLQAPEPKGLAAAELAQYRLLLEEQAYPFEEKGIAVHDANTQRAVHRDVDQWIQASFTALAKVYPARYDKPEWTVEYSDAL